MSNKKAKGKRAKTRRKLRARAKKTVSQLLFGFKESERVQICIDASVHSGMPAHKYQGLAGEVTGKRGNAFEVAVREGSILRTLIVHPAHLKRLESKS